MTQRQNMALVQGSSPAARAIEAAVAELQQAKAWLVRNDPDSALACIGFAEFQTGRARTMVAGLVAEVS